MPTHPTQRSVRHPYLVTVLVTLGLIIVLAAAGTVSALNGLTGYAPLAVAFVPLAVGLAVWAPGDGGRPSASRRSVGGTG